MAVTGSTTTGTSKRLISASLQDVRGGELDFVDIVHDGRHQLARRVRFEKLRSLPHHFVEDPVAQVGDCGKPDVVDQVIGAVIAQPLGDERCQHGERHHAEYVMEERGDDLVEVNGDFVVGNGYPGESDASRGRVDVEHLVEQGADQ
jgi:hypothetical protein